MEIVFLIAGIAIGGVATGMLANRKPELFAKVTKDVNAVFDAADDKIDSLKK